MLAISLKINIDDMYNVIDRLTPEQRKRYGANYSKTDFSVLQNAYESYKKEE